MPAQLLALSEGPNILLDKPILLLGRHQECDIQIGSRKVSRRHCCLAQVNDHFVVRDLGSTNGIRINGARVVEGSLQPGDELTIGNQRFQLDWASNAKEALPKADKAPRRDRHRNDNPRTQHDSSNSSDLPVPLPERERDRRVPVAAKSPAAPNKNVPEIVAEDLKLKPLSQERPLSGQ